MAAVEGGHVTIVDSGGVGDVITITATAADASGNETTAAFVIHVLNPGKGKAKGR